MSVSMKLLPAGGAGAGTVWFPAAATLVWSRNEVPLPPEMSEFRLGDVVVVAPLGTVVPPTLAAASAAFFADVAAAAACFDAWFAWFCVAASALLASVLAASWIAGLNSVAHRIASTIASAMSAASAAGSQRGGIASFTTT